MLALPYKGAPVHAGSWLQPKTAEDYQIAPSVGSREVLQAGLPSTANHVAVLGGMQRFPVITAVHRK